jgi:hypothetical protein
VEVGHAVAEETVDRMHCRHGSKGCMLLSLAGIGLIAIGFHYLA